MAINVFELVFPIFCGPKEGEIAMVAGTAFCIGPGKYLTAGHCCQTASEYAWSALGYTYKNQWKTVPITDLEWEDDLDLGLIGCENFPEFSSYGWNPEIVVMADDIRSAGYAHGFDAERQALGVRVFSGTIVSVTKLNRLKGVPGIYELSFNCPRGLSGAPIFRPGAKVEISGFVVGNALMEMEVFREKEIEKAEGKESLFIKVEALQLGVAIRCSAVLGYKSALLGSTLEEHLKKEKLLPD